MYHIKKIPLTLFILILEGFSYSQYLTIEFRNYIPPLVLLFIEDVLDSACSFLQLRLDSTLRTSLAFAI